MTTTKSSSPKVVIVCGPTAAGKTSVGVQIAKVFNGEVISADSRQFYKEMSVGTARPTEKEMDGVAHHFVASHSVASPLTAGEFERQAEIAVKEILERKKFPIIVGGSGLFIKALVEGLDDLPASEELRSKLIDQFETEGIESLYNRLVNSDPKAKSQIDFKNPVRVMRAIELVELTKKPLAEIRANRKLKKRFDPIWIGINSPRDELYDRIDHRVDQMLKEGLEEEAKSLQSFQNSDALKTVGYQELFSYFNGEYDREEAIRLIKRNSRRYAKRQLTWFNKIEGINWFEAKEIAQIIKYLNQELKP
ncbi:MAG: tRNA (adenosine(37)-N6)-dimethylallyltransferase MiaA [Flavobacteriales bacterium]|nr:tRNA (adenosine(37)-N6)-dimethylallyltransferase MiaA [Flavobacteriales bacterium]